MIKKILIPFSLLLIFGVSISNAQDTEAPRVIETYPPNGSQDVDPSLSEISVKFSEKMTDKSWSWAYTNKSEFPEINGQPYYRENFTKNVLPVKLQPNKEYIIWLNSQSFSNFKDSSGNSLLPFKYTFKTK